MDNPILVNCLLFSFVGLGCGLVLGILCQALGEVLNTFIKFIGG